jgi:hypothetical protein
MRHMRSVPWQFLFRRRANSRNRNLGLDTSTLREQHALPWAVSRPVRHFNKRHDSTSMARPTTRKVFGRTLVDVSEQDTIEREFFARVKLPNGTFKSTGANRMDDLNAAVFPYIAAIDERPVKIMDVGASSGVSTLEWFECLSGERVTCDVTATDLIVHASLVSLAPSLAVLIDRDRNILHMDVLGQGAPPVAKGLEGIFAGMIRMLFRVAMKVDDRLPPLNGRTQEAATGRVLKCEPVTLLTKRLAQHESLSLRVIEDDLLAANHPQFNEVFHVVRAANILNRCYFSDQVLVQIVNKLKESIKQNGLLVVCRTEHNGANNATLFQSTDSKFRVLLRLGSGSEIEDLITGI